MSDIETRARELLEGITPGPWMVDEDNPIYVIRPDNPPSTWDGLMVARVRGGDGTGIDSLPEIADAEFIAASPDLVRGLLADLAQRDTVIRDIREMHVKYTHGAMPPPWNSQCRNCAQPWPCATINLLDRSAS